MSAARGRLTAADRAVLQAARAVLTEAGLHAVTAEAVAARAGVPVAQVTRRWRNMHELVLDALDEVRPVVVTIDTGSLRGDLEAVFASFGSDVGTDATIEAFDALLAALGDPALRERYWRTAIEPRRSMIDAVFVRAQKRGEIPAGLSTDRLVDLFGGGLLYQYLRPDTDSDLAGRLAETVEVFLGLVAAAGPRRRR